LSAQTVLQKKGGPKVFFPNLKALWLYNLFVSQKKEKEARFPPWPNATPFFGREEKTSGPNGPK